MKTTLTLTEILVMIGFPSISLFIIGITLGANIEENHLKTQYCKTLKAEYHDIRENGVCILPSGEVRDINF